MKPIAQKKHLIRILIMVFFSGSSFFSSFAFENHPIGARSLGLSHASVSFSDTWSVFHNQAGLTAVDAISAAFFYESGFGIDELSLTAGTLVIPAGRGTFAIPFSQFGKGRYKERKTGLAYALPLSRKWSAGLQLDYLSLILPENERSAGFITFEGGVLCHPSEQLTLGAHIFNPVSGGFKSVSGKISLPVTFRIGGHYRFSEDVLAALEAQTDNQHPPLLKTGVEFLMVKNLVLRLGASGKPFNYTAGIGFVSGRMKTDIGFSYHGSLGVTPSISLQFLW